MYLIFKNCDFPASHVSLPEGICRFFFRFPGIWGTFNAFLSSISPSKDLDHQTKQVARLGWVRFNGDWCDIATKKQACWDMYVGVSKNRGILPPKWMVKIRENPYEHMGWFGGFSHYFWKHPCMYIMYIPLCLIIHFWDGWYVVFICVYYVVYMFLLMIFGIWHFLEKM